jgi:iron(III) transport system ATP-binding protein
VIRIVGLRKTYGDVVALDSIDLELADGEVLALLGPSGCGKTTTLQLLAGFMAPDGGEITVGGKVLSRPGAVVPPERRNMSLIFQSYAVWPHKTVGENVAFGLRVRKVPKSEITERVRQILSVVQLDRHEDRYPAELSGGQQQRVALARALVVQPQILLLDEPLSNLDASLREEMRFEIRRVHDTTGITMVYVTHDQSEAMVTADRVAVMNHGRVEQVGTPEEIHHQPQTRFVASFISRANTLLGQLVEPGVVQVGSHKMVAVDATGRRAGDDVAVCVRPKLVSLGSAPDGRLVNRLSGIVLRNAYLGDTRDYLIEIDGGVRLRAVTSPDQKHAVGDRVELFLAADDCLVLDR